MPRLRDGLREAFLHNVATLNDYFLRFTIACLFDWRTEEGLSLGQGGQVRLPALATPAAQGMLTYIPIPFRNIKLNVQQQPSPPTNRARRKTKSRTKGIKRQRVKAGSLEE